MLEETIAAIATPPGEGGIGISRLSGEDAKNKFAEGERAGADHKLHCNTHTQASPYTLANPVVLLRAEILTHKGCDGNTESAGNHPGDAVCLGKGSPCGGCNFAEGIDTGLHQKIGQVKGDKLQAGGETDDQNLFQQRRIH